MSSMVSPRLLFLVGDTLPLAKLSSVPRTCLFYKGARSFSQFKNESGPLTLASLGYKIETETTKKTVKDKLDSSHKVSKSKGKPLMPRQAEPVTRRKALDIDLHQLDSSHNQTKSKGKALRPRQAEPVARRKALDIDCSVFAAKEFSELGLSSVLLERLEEVGYTVPTDVQSTAIPTILKKHDAVIQSYTGSGKTLAYLLPILSEVGPLRKKSDDAAAKSNEESAAKKREIEAVIVAPSRELGMQIVREVEKLLGPTEKRAVQQLVGGANRSRQEEALKKNKPAIVVGTPGRIAEISASGKLHTHGCQFLVLDEVDELLAFNFREDMHRILEHVGRRPGTVPQTSNDPRARKPERQTIMVSATVPFSVVRAARSWGQDPILVKAKSIALLENCVPGATPVNLSGPTPGPNQQTQAASESLPPSLKHYYCVTKPQHKVDTLRRCVHALDANIVIVFMNHTKQLKDTVHKLEARGMKAEELHGDLSKLARSTILKRFKNGEVRVLVTNELAARGLDVPECDLVVNLDLPTDSIHYAHRAGRTGRLGRKGFVVNVCDQGEVFVVKKLERQLGVPVPACELLEGKLVVTGEEKVQETAE